MDILNGTRQIYLCMACAWNCCACLYTDDAKPIKEAPRRLPFNRRNEVKSLINAMLEKEVIERSQSPWSSPLVVVYSLDTMYASLCMHACTPL